MTRPTRPQLQLAIDVLETHEAIAAVEQTHESVDLVEIGTPLIIEQGLAPVEQIRRRWPKLRVLADVKIMDAGHFEATSAFKRGAAIATVLAVADNATIRGALQAASEHGGTIMADLINTPDPAARARELRSLGVSTFCVHTAYDTKANPLAKLQAVRAAVDGTVAVAGGVKLNMLDDLLNAGADIVVVGGSIMTQPDRRAAAAAFAARLRQGDST
jgi:3-hexulose-6-phosphate synthase